MKKFVVLLVIITILISSLPLQAKEGDTSTVLTSNNVTKVFETDTVKGDLNEVIMLKDGSYVGCGATYEDLKYYDDYKELRTPGDEKATAYIVKYKQDGSIAFLKTFGGDGNDVFYNIIETADGGFVVTGSTHSKKGGNFDQFGLVGLVCNVSTLIVKYDKDGNVKWSKIINDSTINCLSINQNNEIVLFYLEGGTYFILTLTNDGGTKNNKAMSALTTNVLSVLFNKDGSFFVCGTNHEEDAFISKYDANFNLIFSKIFAGNGRECFESIMTTSDGNIVVTGRFRDTTGGGDFEKNNIKLAVIPGSESDKIFGNLTVKYSSKGELLGVNYIQAMNHICFMYGMIPLADGASLVKYDTASTITDPISKQIFEATVPYVYGTYYMYRTNSEGKFNYVYKIEAKFLLGLLKFFKQNDGSYKITQIEDNKIFRVYNYADMYNLQMVVNSTININNNGYSVSSWNSYQTKLNTANNILSSNEKNQSTVNSVATELENAIKDLTKGSQAINTEDNLQSSHSTESNINVTASNVKVLKLPLVIQQQLNNQTKKNQIKL